MRIADLDPCMTAGFLLHNEAELKELRDFWKVRRCLCIWALYTLTGHQKHGLTAITSFVEASLSRSADILAVDDFDEL